MFVSDDKSRSQSKSPTSVLIQSPKKNPNSVHFKEHTAIFCNEENLKRFLIIHMRCLFLSGISAQLVRIGAVRNALGIRSVKIGFVLFFRL